MRTLPLMLITWFFAAVAALTPVAARFADGTVVRAILFYSPNCSHCHHVMAELLEPMLANYQDQLKIIGVDISQPMGSKLYHAAVERYGIPSERRGVPTLIVGDAVLIGSREIPDQFPALVAEGLARGGIPWPDIPGLAQQIAQMQSELSLAVTPQANTSASSASSSTPAPGLVMLDTGEDQVLTADDQNLPADLLGFGLAGVVLAGMTLSFGFSCWRISRPGNWQRIVRVLTSDRPSVYWGSTRMIPLLALAGLAVAAYLAYVEITHVAAVCGPLGECNVVQTSAYALFLGLPVAVWGLLYYLIVVALWAGKRYLAGRLANLSLLGLLGLTLFGVLFSMYLTCLELFAIRAICSWCLSSAVITTVLMLLAANAITSMEHAYPRRLGVHPEKQERVHW